MLTSRRNFITGFIAAPAVLRLGIHMPIKSIIKPVIMETDHIWNNGIRDISRIWNESKQIWEFILTDLKTGKKFKAIVLN